MNKDKRILTQQKIIESLTQRNKELEQKIKELSNSNQDEKLNEKYEELNRSLLSMDKYKD